MSAVGRIGNPTYATRYAGLSGRFLMNWILMSGWAFHAAQPLSIILPISQNE